MIKEFGKVEVTKDKILITGFVFESETMKLASDEALTWAISMIAEELGMNAVLYPKKVDE